MFICPYPFPFHLSNFLNMTPLKYKLDAFSNKRKTNKIYLRIYCAINKAQFKKNKIFPLS